MPFPACIDFVVVSFTTEKRGRHPAARPQDPADLALIIARVAGQDGQPVIQRRRRDDQIGLRKGMPRFPALFDQ